jgi:hypothetical protein
MKTLISLIALTTTLGLAACSNDDHESLRSATKGKNVHADAVNTDNSDDATGVPADHQDHSNDQKLPDDNAHSTNTTDNTQTGNTPDGGSSSGSGSVADQPMDERPTVGIRNFRQITDTMAALTGVPKTTPAIVTALAATGGGLETQLPDNNDIRTFAGSHQVAISKLAVEFCDAMVESPALAAAAVPGFDFTMLPAAAFDATGKTQVAKSLLEKFWGAGLESNPNEAETLATLTALIDDISAGKAATAVTTKSVVKGVCTALLSTGPVLFL